MYEQRMRSLEAITDQNEYEYELFMMKQQVNSLKALLFAEKMKTQDAPREKKRV